MQTRLVFAVVVGVAAAGLGAAMVFGSRDPQPVQAPAAVAPTEDGETWSDTTYAVQAPTDTPASDLDGDARTPEDRLGRFDAGEFEQMSREERRERMRAMRAEWEARMDTNGDGVVDDDERLDAMLSSPRGRRLLEEFDADGDGMLGESERQALRDEQARREAERERRMLDRYDTDGDGVLSPEEELARRDEQSRQRRERMEQMAAEFDRDGDGELNADEQANARQTLRERREIDSFVGRYDSNGDGRITTVDFNAFLVLYQSQDSRADVNRDGVVNTLDVNAFRDMMARSGNRP